MSVRNGRHRSTTRLTPLGWVVVVAVLLLPASVLVRWPAPPGRAQGTVLAGATVTTPGSGTATTPSPAPPASTVAGLPACSVADLEAPDADYEDWDRTILDTAYRLPTGYQPPDLVPLGEAGFDEDLQIRSLVVADLSAMRLAAADADVPIAVVAAYRSFTLQADLFDRRTEHLGYAVAIAKTAQPGHSEHQLGTTLDFKTQGAKSVSVTWGGTPTGLWMAANAYRFGFVMSYPDGATARTCYGYEPWHFRYFGPALAERIHDSGLTPREFLWQEGHPAAGG
jgi:D-alanyl-D-alanine carboxypeptidase